MIGINRLRLAHCPRSAPSHVRVVGANRSYAPCPDSASDWSLAPDRRIDLFGSSAGTDWHPPLACPFYRECFFALDS
jgi:hypothetical protein